MNSAQTNRIGKVSPGGATNSPCEHVCKRPSGAIMICGTHSGRPGVPIQSLAHRGPESMATATLDPTVKSLAGAEVKEVLQQVRRTDNLTNWYYLLRSYLMLALVIGGAVYFFEHWSAWGLHWTWNIPVAVVAVILVGAGQHQL